MFLGFAGLSLEITDDVGLREGKGGEGLSLDGDKSHRERDRREEETVADIACNAICVVVCRYRNFLVYPAEINLINYAVINEILDRER